MSDRIDVAVKNVKQQLDAFKQKVELRGAKKWGSLPQRMRYVVITLSEAAFFLATGLIETFSFILLKSYVIYPFLFYGILLVSTRSAKYKLCRKLNLNGEYRWVFDSRFWNY